MKMLKALISVKPVYAERIASGEKTVEYRKAIMREKPDRLIIYATQPVGRILGEVDLIGVSWGDPEKIWERTRASGGISREAYDNYFTGRDVAVAYELGEFIPNDNGTTLADLGLRRPPQAYAYVRR